MPIVLSRGEFFGRVVSAAQWEPFRISETHYARGALLPWHRHEESYLTFVLSGGYRERSAARTQACAARSLILHPAGETHEDDFAEHATRCLNVVAAAGFTARLPRLGGMVVEGPHVASAGARLSAELRRADAASPLIIEGLLLELFGTLSRSDASERRDTPAWLAEANGIIEKRFAEKIALAGIAAAVSKHPVHLARAFRRRYGMSVGERIRALRLEWARERVAAGAALAVAASEAGFADQSHFTKAFTRAHGVAPSEYRRRLRASRVPGR